MMFNVGIKRRAALIGLGDEDNRLGWWVLHLVVHPRFWVWGFSETRYDGPIYQFGIGPLLLFCWQPWR